MYPTPYDKVRLGALDDLKLNFPNVTIGLSDHSIGNYTCFAAIPYGALILEKHFTSNKKWKGPDIPVSIDPKELKQLIEGSAAIKQALDGKKTILNEEQPTIKFAYASVVTTENIKKNDFFTEKNIWVKRPGTGEIPALQYDNILKKRAKKNIPKNKQLSYSDIS
jgi:N-acetylneuraminate synthase